MLRAAVVALLLTPGPPATPPPIAPVTPPAILPASPPPAGSLATLDRIAAVVGDEIVLESEIERLLAVGLLARRPGETDRAYRDRVLDDAIVDLLWEQQLRRGGAGEPDPRDVQARLDEVVARAEVVTGRPFDETLRRAQATRAEVLGWIRRGIALETFVKERLSPRVKVPDADVKTFYDGKGREELAGRGFKDLPGWDDLKPDVKDLLRDLLRERRLNQEIERWTGELKDKTRIVIYRR